MEFKIELLTKTIEEQNVTISKYKTKLKDLVTAYKNLSEEKSALEASIAALKNFGPLAASNKNGEFEKIEAGQTTDESSSQNMQENAANQSEEPPDEGSASTTNQTSQDMKSQIDVVVSSLLTVTQQKERLEASCLAERKQFRAELNEQNAEIDKLNRKLSEAEAENKEWRVKLRNQQSEHDKQQNDCSLMMRELQSLLNSERIINEQLSSQIEDLKVELEQKKRATSAHIAILSNKEISLKEELETASKKLEEALDKLNQPVLQIAELEKQVKEAKESDEKLRRVEGRKLEEAEMKIAELSETSEARICSLEEKILELSEMLGNAEKCKLNDQSTIQKLKEKNIQLDQENKTLFALTEKTNALEEMSPQEIMAKFRAVIPLLVSSGQDLSALYEELNIGDDLHKNCRVQLEQVQEEFGRYKLRAQSVLKNKSKDSSNESEVNQLKKQLSELKERISHMKNDLHTKELELQNKDESCNKIVSCLNEKHKSELSQLNVDWQQKVAGLENEMRKQRERTVSMLAEKEQEIAELKFYTSPIARHRSESEKLSPKPEVVFSKATMFQSSSLIPDDNGIGASSASIEEGNETVSHNQDSAIKHLLSRRNDASLLGKETGNLLHFVQEKARLEMELAMMRKQKIAAEATAREVQYLLVLKDDEHSLETKALKESLRKVERDVGRESANLEYLKNVVYQYMLCKETLGRQQMFNAISTILQFSPHEKQTVQARKGWKL